MIVISTMTFDPLGFEILKIAVGSKLTGKTRRVTKTKTLDGGSSVVDFGFSDSDREFNVQVSGATEESVRNISRMMQQYRLFRVSTKEGCFSCAISSMTHDENPFNIVLTVKEKISA